MPIFLYAYIFSANQLIVRLPGIKFFIKCKIGAILDVILTSYCLPLLYRWITYDVEEAGKSPHKMPKTFLPVST